MESAAHLITFFEIGLQDLFELQDPCWSNPEAQQDSAIIFYQPISGAEPDKTKGFLYDIVDLTAGQTLLDRKNIDRGLAKYSNLPLRWKQI